MEGDNPRAKSQLIVWWALWGAMQAGVFFYYFFLPGPPAAPATDAAWMWGTLPVFLSAIVRWLILPRMSGFQGGLAAMLVGIALAEVSCFLGIFLFPTHRLDLLCFSALGIFQFVPFYAPRFVVP